MGGRGAQAGTRLGVQQRQLTLSVRWLAGRGRGVPRPPPAPCPAGRCGPHASGVQGGCGSRAMEALPVPVGAGGHPQHAPRQTSWGARAPGGGNARPAGQDPAVCHHHGSSSAPPCQGSSCTLQPPGPGTRQGPRSWAAPLAGWQRTRSLSESERPSTQLLTCGGSHSLPLLLPAVWHPALGSRVKHVARQVQQGVQPQVGVGRVCGAAGWRHRGVTGTGADCAIGSGRFACSPLAAPRPSGMWR